LGFRLEEPIIARVVETRARTGEPRLFDSTALPLHRPPANPVPARDVNGQIVPHDDAS